MLVNKKECTHAGLDIKKIESIARRISKAAKEAGEIGVEIFGGSGTGTLRFSDDRDKRPLLIAVLDGIFDGGDGGAIDDDENLLRGE